MTEKELRKLGRGDLLNLLLEQSRENQKMRSQKSLLRFQVSATNCAGCFLSYPHKVGTINDEARETI